MSGELARQCLVAPKQRAPGQFGRNGMEKGARRIGRAWTLAERHELEAMADHLVFVEDIAQIDDDRRFHQIFQTRQIERPELIPFGDENDGIRPFCDFVGVATRLASGAEACTQFPMGRLVEGEIPHERDGCELGKDRQEGVKGGKRGQRLRGLGRRLAADEAGEIEEWEDDACRECHRELGGKAPGGEVKAGALLTG